MIIGGGFAGIELAKQLKDSPVDVVMLDKHNYHTFQPLLYQVAIGTLKQILSAFLSGEYLPGRKTSSFY